MSHARQIDRTDPSLVRPLLQASISNDEQQVVAKVLLDSLDTGKTMTRSELVDAVASEMELRYRKLWMIDGGLWGAAVARLAADRVVLEAEGLLFERL